MKINFATAVVLNLFPGLWSLLQEMTRRRIRECEFRFSSVKLRDTLQNKQHQPFSQTSSSSKGTLVTQVAKTLSDRSGALAWRYKAQPHLTKANDTRLKFCSQQTASD